MRITTTFILALTISQLAAQSTDIPLNSWAYPVLEEWDVKGEEGVFTAIKPIRRSYFAEVSENVTWKLTHPDQSDLSYLFLETREYQDSIPPSKKGLFNTLYKYPSDFFSYTGDAFDLHINPVWALEAGKDQDGRLDEVLYQNYRGLELRGTVDQKVSFYTLLTENQARYADYVRDVIDSTLAVPYEGFWKQYGDTGVDFLRAQGYIDLNASSHIGVQFGFGKHFIGYGKRSLVLSDFGNNYPYLRLNTKVWKIQYTNIFAQLVARTEGGDFGLLGTGSFPKKYMANHHLSVQIKPNLTVGLFESVIQGDSSNNFNLGMLNPIIFYKAVEQQDGSGGNTILGLDFKWILWKRLSLYGQLAIDELVVSELTNNTGWWGNKQGFQLGGKYFDAFGLKNLDLQMELNRVRPYLYAHESDYTSYSHYNMALAHPLGANFREVIGSFSYQPIPKLKFKTDVLIAKYGNDLNGLSYGRDILEPYDPDNRPGDYGNDMFQGETVDLQMIHINVQYMLIHNMILDLSTIYRKETSELGHEEQAQIITFGMYWNFPSRSYLF